MTPILLFFFIQVLYPKKVLLKSVAALVLTNLAVLSYRTLCFPKEPGSTRPPSIENPEVLLLTVIEMPRPS